ncbi:prenyltransferase/squalene oxidase repeat-containing protein [Verrucomicrobiota bacterium]
MNSDHAEIAAYVCGELDGPEREAFEGRLRTESELNAEVERLAEVVASLKATPPEQVSRDLAPDVMRGIPAAAWQAEAPQAVFRVYAGRAAAALLVVLLGSLLLGHLRRGTPRPEPRAGATSRTVEHALDWLVQAQEPDGSWDPEQWHGQPQYRVALSGLAVLAFLRHEAEEPGRDRQAAVDRAVDFILSEQRDTGRFGPDVEQAMYNHGMAAAALMESYIAAPRDRLRAPITHALTFIRERQLDSGGWGYAPVQVKANTGVSVWQIYALRLADDAGMRGNSAAYRRGLRWLVGMMDEGGRFGYEVRGDRPEASATLTAMGAFSLFSALPRFRDAQALTDRVRLALVASLAPPEGRADRYRWFFTASAARKGECGEIDPWLARVAATLSKAEDESDLGKTTWDPADSWSKAGGRVYTAAMTALILPTAGSG